MPKLAHNFVQGKMNKDLDERLVPPGQYRDALNIQVSTSEGSDVGAVENILGNTKLNKKSSSVNWAANFGLTSAKCIGTTRDTQNNKLYWFVTSASVDAILEYDEVTGFVAPILVDTSTVLNFSTNNFITGVNIFDDLLCWTDNLNEPRKILISRFKAGSTQSGTSINTHTQVYSRAFIASDITVIKKKPNQRLHFAAAASTQTGNGVGISYVKGDKNVYTTVGGVRYLREVGDAILIDLESTVSSWASGDIIICQANEANTSEYDTEHEMRIVVTSIGGSGTILNGTIQSVPAELRDQIYSWSMIKEEEEPMWPLSFPRFGYRWRYVDGEVSAFSPWTEPVFVPGPFKYGGVQGYNKGMSNNIRKLTLNNWETAPADVEEIQILYKDSSENPIYVVDKLPRTATTFEITNTLITSVLPTDQLLRVYDNVPRKAKAQEVIGNRLVYANYLQNFDVPTGVAEGLGNGSYNTDIGITISSSNIATLNTPEPTLKTMRTYQAGIVYVDDHGRESPVFTNKNAVATLDIDKAAKVNSLSLIANQAAPPVWAKHFKYYLKETSNEYYNVALDRFYIDPDGSIWLSMLSAERNKVTESDFLVLKKKWNVDEPVTSMHRYKVLDISNEAPASIRIAKKFHTRTQVLRGSTNVIGIGNNEFTVVGPSLSQNDKFFNSFDGTTYIKIEKGSDSTNFYEVEEAGATGKTLSSSPNGDFSLVTNYKFKLVKDLQNDAAFANNLSNPSDTMFISVYREESDPKPEYGGRFFVNINRDSGIDENILYNYTDNPDDYTVKQNSSGDDATLDISLNVTDDPDANSPEPVPGGGTWGFDEHSNATTNPITSWTGNISSGTKRMQFVYAPYFTTSDGTSSGLPLANPIGANFNDDEQALLGELAAGELIQFKNGSSFDTPLYTVASVTKGTYDRQTGTTGDEDDETGYYVQVITTEPFVENFTPTGIRVAARSRSAREVIDSDSNIAPTSNPPIFEVEPLETADVELYYEVSEAYPISQLNSTKVLDFFNAYSFGNGVESNRIRDDFNAKTIGKGVRVSTTLEEPYKEERRKSGIIYSGLYNSTSGVNELNQFNAGLSITKDLNPIYGGIQILKARDSDLVTLCEDKCFRILANKDALFNADGNANLLASDRVLGQAVPYAGEFGISKNPESFTTYGFRSYFTDKSRGAVLRLSMDGLTEISEAGMSDYFEDKLTATTGAILGSYDESSGSYNVSFSGDESVAFKEGTTGWPTRMTFVPEAAISLNNGYYTMKNGELWVHNSATRSNFYGVQSNSTVTPIFNDAPSSIKNFKTLSYEGDAGWVADVLTDQQDGEVEAWKKKENLYFNYIKGKATTLSNIDTGEFSVQGLGNVLTHPADKVIIINGEINASLQIGDVIYSTAGVTSPAVLRVIGTVATISMPNQITLASSIPSPAPATGNFMLFAKDSEKNTSGIIGYHASVEMKTTSSDKKELFAVNSEVFISSE